MIRTAMHLHRPSTLDEATDLLSEHGDRAAVLGGGTMLLPLMGRGERSVEHLIDPVSLDLSAIRVADGHVEIGARVTYSQILNSEQVLACVPPLIDVAARITGGAQLRNQATLGGAACCANPGSDAPAVLLALDAIMVLHGPEGVRAVDAADFFRDAFSTAIAAGELLRGIRVPSGSDLAFAYVKLKHSEGSWPVATAAAVASADLGLRVTVGAAGPVPITVAAEDPGRVAELVDAALTEGWSDELAPASYRRAVAPVVARRAAEKIIARRTS